MIRNKPDMVLSLENLRIVDYNSRIFPFLSDHQGLRGKSINDILLPGYQEIFPVLVRQEGEDFVLHFMLNGERKSYLTQSVIEDNQIKLKFLQYKTTIDLLKLQDIEESVMDQIAVDLLEKSLEYVIIVNSDGTVIAMNQYPSPYQPSDIMEQSMYDFVLEDTSEIFETTFQKVLNEMASYNCEIHTQSDKYFLTKMIPYQFGDSKYVALLASDNTELNMMRRQLQETVEKYEQIMSKSPFGIMISRGEEIHYVNQKLLDLTGWTEEEMLNDIGSAELISEDSIKKLIIYRENRLKGIEVPENYEIDILTKDGNSIPIRHRVTMAEYNGEIAAFSFVEDIRMEKQLRREREKMMESLNHKSRLEALGTMAASLAHELNNYLFVILGNSELLVAMEEDEISQVAIEINSAATDTRDLIKQVLDFTGNTGKDQEIVIANDLIKETQQFIISSITNSKVELQLNAEESTISANPTQIKQILLNLSRNADHAMGENGKIIIKTGIKQFDTEEILELNTRGQSLTVGTNYLDLSVQDFGHGINDEKLNHIFEPFYSTKDDGRGMGLSVVLGIIRSHQGGISISTSEKGTTIHCYFPLLINPSLDDEFESTSINSKKLEGSSILIVEDNLVVGKTLKNMLESLFLKSTLCSSRDEAVKLLSESKYDLIMMDIAMPGMDIKQFFEKLHDVIDDLPIIFTSGYDDQNIQKYLDKKHKYFIHKPYTLDEIHLIISKIFETI